jgi:hypothetical protein
MPPASEAPYYYYDPKIGDQTAEYVPTAVARPEFGRPEMPANFVATVEGETIIGTFRGDRTVPWRAEPGTECVILGYWSDGTVRVSWPAIRGAYRVDGRFPAWVVEEDPDAPMAAGGHILKANALPGRRRRRPDLLQRLAVFLGLTRGADSRR